MPRFTALEKMAWQLEPRNSMLNSMQDEDVSDSFAELVADEDVLESNELEIE